MVIQVTDHGRRRVLDLCQYDDGLAWPPPPDTSCDRPVVSYRGTRYRRLSATKDSSGHLGSKKHQAGGLGISCLASS